MSEDNVRVVVTGTSWMGTGVGSIESALDNLFREARDEITLTVYTIGTGADLIFEWLEGALARGILIRLVINDLEDQPTDVVARLHSLAGGYQHFHLYDFSGKADSALHAKAVVVDHRMALVGSSNMSRRGLLANHELAVLVEGPAAAVTGQAMDALLSSPMVKRVVSFGGCQ